MSSGAQANLGNSRFWSPRFEPDCELVVNSKTIGTSLSYKLSSEDVSETGLLLSWSHETRVPFLKNTLIEMEIDPEGIWLESPLECVGRVVRKFTESGAKFGVVIVQMDPTSISQWERCVGELEQRVKSKSLAKTA